MEKERRVFKTTPGEAIGVIQELVDNGWTVLATANTSTPTTDPDAHGMSYGGPSFEILVERNKQLSSFQKMFKPKNPNIKK